MEFALVFPVFFLLFYGILAYGLIFLMRLSLQHAAEDGARAALRQLSDTQGQTQLQARVNAAKKVSKQQASWMNITALNVEANVCLSSVVCEPTAAAITETGCGSAVQCQLVISVRYNYDGYPIIPKLPGFGLVLPNQLEGRGRVLLDGRAL